MSVDPDPAALCCSSNLNLASRSDIPPPSSSRLSLYPYVVSPVTGSLPVTYFSNPPTLPENFKPGAPPYFAAYSAKFSNPGTSSPV